MPTEKTEGLLREKMVRALMRDWHAKKWQPFLEGLGLTDQDMVDRLVRLLVLHLMLDRAVTAGLTLRLLDPTSPTFVKVEAAVAKLDMGKRIGLANASNIISDSCAADIYAVNDARNNIAHYQAKKGWRLDIVKEISSAEAFEACAEKGMRAFAEATKIFGPLK
jgi:hypothetical protein